MPTKKKKTSWGPALVRPPDPSAPLREWHSYRAELDVLEARLRVGHPDRWECPTSHSQTWRLYRPKYTKPSWPCRPRIATTAPRSTRPCGGINLTDVHIEQRLDTSESLNLFASVQRFLLSTRPCGLFLYHSTLSRPGVTRSAAERACPANCSRRLPKVFSCDRQNIARTGRAL